uniref:CSON012950 protein n=1 Tax=Culicoides sonorensis TaxID=179676 RepID=A0A336M6Y3_CULSO
MSFDNPNYFNTLVSKSEDDEQKKQENSGSKGFFLFRRKSSTSSKQKGDKKSSVAKQDLNCNGNNGSNLNKNPKHKGSFRSLLRSKSGSSNTMSPPFSRSSTDEVDYASPNVSLGGTLGRYRLRQNSFNDNSCHSADNDDVFLSTSHHDSFMKQKFSTTLRPNSAKNVITPTLTAESRRHSIGSFIAKEKTRTGSVSDQVPAMPAPKPPAYNSQTVGARLKNHYKMGDSQVPKGTDDILVVTARQSEPGILWVNYLKTCFDKITKQRGRVPFNFLHLKIDEDNLTTTLIQRCLATKLQIVIICPALISLSPMFLMTQLTSILKPEKVLGLLLDVTEAKLSEIHKSMLPNYKQWRRCIVRNQDQSFVSDLLGIATDILGRALRQQPTSTEMLPSPLHISTSVTKPTTPTSTENFTILPRKVKIGQNKVVVLLNDPLSKDDWIKIKIERTGHTSEVTNVKRRNPYAIQFNIPDICMEVSCMINVRVEKNNQDLGMRPIKCESRLKELELLLKFQDMPMEFMCNSLGIIGSDRDKLDTYLVESFKKNVPPYFHLLSTPAVEHSNVFKGYREMITEEYPTMLHFAARWGLEKLCVTLLECPGGVAACELKSCSGKTPSDLAELSGHIKLSTTIKNFTQMNEFSTVYQYFKGISETDTNTIKLEQTITSLSIFSGDTNKQEDTIVENQLPEKVPAEGYLVMSGSNSGGSDVTDSGTAINAVSNLNYLNVTEEDTAACSLIELGEIPKVDEHVLVGQDIMTNELKITEPVYFDSQEVNQKSDILSQECTNTLDNLTSLNSSLDSGSEYQNDSIISVKSSPGKSLNNFSINESEMRNCETIGDFGDYLTHPSNIPVDDSIADSPRNLSKIPQSKSLPLRNQLKLSLPPNATNLLSDSENSLTSPNKMMARSKTNPFLEEASHVKLHFKKKDDDAKSSKSSTLKRQGSDLSKKSVDDELLEIINDFKNNVFTIQEVEQLVATWKQRNDVQQSVTERHEQLQKMREEYDRIQREMKDKLKRPTPFERVRKLFSRSKTPTKETPSTATTPTVDDIKFSLVNNQPNHRPISSLSLHSVSSSSSGRMSTGSACSSLGDSGTHSDNETRRNLFGSCRIGNAGSLMENYLIPPTPRPLTSSQEMMRQASEHYIMFPSNIPYTPPTDPTHISNADYINYPTLKTIVETKETEIPVSVQTIQLQKTEHNFSSLPAYLNPSDINELNTNGVSSSFKPNSPAVTVNTINTQYTDNKNTEQILNELKFNEICKSIEDLTRSPQSPKSGCSSEASNSTVQSPQHTTGAHHDYMNIKI